MLKDGEYRVEYIKHGKLYVKVNGNLMRITNPYDYEPSKIKLVSIDGKIYIEDFAPKIETEKPRKKSTKSKDKGEE